MLKAEVDGCMKLHGITEHGVEGKKMVNGNELKNGFAEGSNGKSDGVYKRKDVNRTVKLNNGYAEKSNGINGDAIAETKKKKTVLREKVFIERNSLLTDLYEVKSIKHLYYVFIVILMALIINYLAHDIIYLGELRLESNLVWINFSDLPQVALGWSAISFFNIFVYFGFKVWSAVHIKISHIPVLRKIWNWIGIIAFLSHCIKSLQIASDFIVDYEIYLIGSGILITEQVRLLMKSYAYVRSNVSKTLNYQQNQSDGLTLPSLSYYVYFLFVPTLIYRDEYPRTKTIRWSKVLVHFLEVFAVIVFMSFLYQNTFVSLCAKYRVEKFTAWDIIWACIKNTLPSMGLLVMVFYLLLHSWMNAFAEITRFADRQFYQDWWNSTTFSDYYRKWNIVVHDWLYTYIYRDLYENITGQNAFLSKLAVFFISSIFHEYIAFNFLRMFYPVLFILFFTNGAFVTYVRVPNNSFFNILFLYGMSLGASISLSMYVIEFCLRDNECAWSIQSPLKPRTFASDCYK